MKALEPISSSYRYYRLAIYLTHSELRINNDTDLLVISLITRVIYRFRKLGILWLKIDQKVTRMNKDKIQGVGGGTGAPAD